jgi:hypothetical protein
MKKIIALSTVPAIFALLAITNLNLSSCTKSNPVTIRDTTFVTVHDTTIVKDTITKAPSILSMFTGKQWELDSVYTNYTGPGTGTLVYARGSSSNISNFDNYYATWTIDGYLWQVENGTYYSSTWGFINSDSTTYKVVSTVYGTDYGRITKLDASHLTVYDSIANALDVEILTP